MLYTKVGKRYRPCTTALSYPYQSGWYLVHVDENVHQTYHSVDPDMAAAEAALHLIEDEICRQLALLTSGRPAKRQLTPRERLAWQTYCKIIGDENSTISTMTESPAEVARRVIDTAVKTVRSKLGEKHAST